MERKRIVRKCIEVDGYGVALLYCVVVLRMNETERSTGLLYSISHYSSDTEIHRCSDMFPNSC